MRGPVARPLAPTECCHRTLRSWLRRLPAAATTAATAAAGASAAAASGAPAS